MQEKIKEEKEEERNREEKKETCVRVRELFLSHNATLHLYNIFMIQYSKPMVGIEEFI